MQNFKDGIVPVPDNRLKSLVNYGVTALSNRYSGNELHHIIWWLVEHFAEFKETDLIANDSIHLNQSNIIHFCNAIEKLKSGMPVQYVIGEMEFMGFKFKVNDAVLIPRPETEELVDLIVKECKDMDQPNIMDIGTGSGCIAISLAGLLAHSKVTAVDKSYEALELAKTNAIINNLNGIEWLEMDVLNGDNFINKEFDIIVSNPPYVTISEKETMADHVLAYEPHLALFVDDDDPLIFYRRIAEMIKYCLKPNGRLYLEVNEKYAVETAELFMRNSNDSVTILNDMYTKPRFIKLIRS